MLLLKLLVQTVRGKRGCCTVQQPLMWKWVILLCSLVIHLPFESRSMGCHSLITLLTVAPIDLWSNPWAKHCRSHHWQPHAAADRHHCFGIRGAHTSTPSQEPFLVAQESRPGWDLASLLTPDPFSASHVLSATPSVQSIIPQVSAFLTPWADTSLMVPSSVHLLSLSSNAPTLIYTRIYSFLWCLPMVFMRHLTSD